MSSAAYARSFDEMHNASKVVSCVDCARTLRWLDMLTLTQAGWTMAVADGRLEWRCPEHPAPERAPLAGRRESETAGGVPPARKRVARRGVPARSVGRRRLGDCSVAPKTIRVLKPLSRPRGAFGVAHEVAIAPSGAVDERALCGVSARHAQVAQAFANVTKCRRCDRILRSFGTSRK